MTSKKQRLEEAKQYLGYCYKEGAWEPGDEGWDSLDDATDEEIIILAEGMIDKADAYADSVRKGE